VGRPGHQCAADLPDAGPTRYPEAGAGISGQGSGGEGCQGEVSFPLAGIGLYRVPVTGGAMAVPGFPAYPRLLVLFFKKILV